MKVMGPALILSVSCFEASSWEKVSRSRDRMSHIDFVDQLYTEFEFIVSILDKRM